ncbi:hypothetical protein MycrhDRAFT_5514 [Mycolicibacterium rhodesiae JS60]|nr:hypothetical protein MycrhDRAFT_5514 [Mycolicibacterium rhodesiae JS60]
MIFVIFYVMGMVILSWVLSFLARQQQRVLVGAVPQAAADAVRTRIRQAIRGEG